MKNLFKTIAITAVSLLSMHSYSQTFGIRSGFNLATFGGEYVDFEMNPGFHLGGSYNYKFSDVFSLESALLLSTTGYKASYQGEFNKGSMNVTIYNLNNSIMAKGTFKVGKYTNVYTQAGPYVGMAVNGKSRYEFEVDGETLRELVIYNWDDFENGRFDLGLTFGTGVEWRAFQFGIGYDLGLNRHILDSDDWSNRVLKIAVGYNFDS